MKHRRRAHQVAQIVRREPTTGDAASSFAAFSARTTQSLAEGFGLPVDRLAPDRPSAGKRTGRHFVRRSYDAHGQLVG